MSTTEGILNKVRNLLARAASTEFEAERKTCLAKADMLMEKYAIDQTLLAMGEDKRGRAVERRDFDTSWYADQNVPNEVRTQIFMLWGNCVSFCRCYSEGLAWNYKGNGVWEAAVFGTPSDLDYLDLLFTDLWLQMSLKLKPQYDPNLTLGHNIYIAKEAGMKWKEICEWTGHTEWLGYNQNGKYDCVKKTPLIEYKNYLKSVGREGERIVIHPVTYSMSFMSGFVEMIRQRFRAMRETRAESQGDNSMALVVRDIRKQAQEMFWEDFPHLHPNSRDEGKATVRYSTRGGRSFDVNAIHKGREAGGNARIASPHDNISGGKRKEIS